MTAPYYTNIDGVTDQQRTIIDFINQWVHTKKTPVPKQEIMIAMKLKNIPFKGCEKSCYALIEKGYIRRAYTSSHKTYYVLLRTI
jgi:SOS-response transcriptional repressor LexA